MPLPMFRLTGGEEPGKLKGAKSLEKLLEQLAEGWRSSVEEHWLKVGGALLCHQLMEQGSSNVLHCIVLHKLT